MTSLHEADLPYLDFFDPEFQADPGAACGRARQQSWVARCPFGAAILSRQAVHDMLRERRLRTPGRVMTDMFGISEGPFQRWWAEHILSLDGERHTRIRRLVNPAFSPTRAEEARGISREIITEILDRIAPLGHCDVAREISGEFPIRVLCRLIGVPEVDVPRFRAWTHMIGAGMDMNLGEIINELNEAIEGLCTYVEEIIRSRQQNPVRPPDLVQTMIDATEAGDRLTIDEVRDQVVLLLGAGYDTTSTQISWSVLTYLDHLTEWKRLATEPDRAAAAVEELLRYSPAIGMTARLAAEDFEYNGILFPQGSYLLLSVPSAGRDPASFDDPDSFRVGRSAEQTHLTFGFGSHYCLGANLARVELQEALPEMARRLVDPRRAGEVKVGNPFGVWDVQTLPIEFTPEVVAV